jgi:hypothetical protein
MTTLHTVRLAGNPGRGIAGARSLRNAKARGEYGCVPLGVARVMTRCYQAHFQTRTFHEPNAESPIWPANCLSHNWKYAEGYPLADVYLSGPSGRAAEPWRIRRSERIGNERSCC